MPSMSCTSMHLPIGWNGLTMLTEGCSVCMPIVIILSLFCSTPLSLKLIMTMDMHTEHPSVVMLSPCQLIDMCTELEGILGRLRCLSMCIDDLGTNIRWSKSPFPLDLMKPSSCLDGSLSTIPTRVLLRESSVY